MVSDIADESDAIKQKLESMPTTELIQIALTANDANDEEDNLGWDAIWVLHYRETRDVFEAAKLLCGSNETRQRSIGVTILAQHGIPNRIYLNETLDIFLNLLKTEQDDDVLNSLTVGLGHIGHEPRKIGPLMEFKNHPNPKVRFGVAFGLLGEEDPVAIQTLIELSSDEDDETRDWATFGLGSMIDIDTPEIRQALFTRASDLEDTSDALGEGIAGLIARHDERALSLTLKALEAGYDGPLILDAAEALADPRLYTALINLRSTFVAYEDYRRRSLEDAIKACQE